MLARPGPCRVADKHACLPSHPRAPTVYTFAAEQLLLVALWPLKPTQARARQGANSPQAAQELCFGFSLLSQQMPLERKRGVNHYFPHPSDRSTQPHILAHIWHTGLAAPRPVPCCSWQKRALGPGRDRYLMSYRLRNIIIHISKQIPIKFRLDCQLPTNKRMPLRVLSFR